METSPQSKSARVTVSLDAGLLHVIDTYARKSEVPRSAIFEDALRLWYESVQEESDREFYSKEAEDPSVPSWSKVSSKAARYVWND